MKKYLHTALFITLLLLGSLQGRGYTLGNETLKYVITYKWGLVVKDAGEATLTLRHSGDKYHALLAAKTLPWADKVYMVRDTLKSTILATPFRALRYEKIAHEGEKYGKDVITYTYSGENILAKADRVKIKDGATKRSSKNFSSRQEAFDMLSIFYYLRTIDYSTIKKGYSMKKIVFSGSKAETITIRNLGIESIKLRSGKRCEGYHIRFNFTSDGGKKSSDDMDTWISTSANHVPLQLEGSLPLGKVKCYLIE